MMEALTLLTNMQWPAAAAVVGIAFAVSVPIVVRRRLKNIERLEEFRLKRAIQLESFKKGALSYIEENG